MGAFFAVRLTERMSEKYLLWTLSEALLQQGFAKPNLLRVGQYVVGLCPRKNDKLPRRRLYDNGDFIALVGSIIVRGRRDADALDFIYENLDSDGQLLDDAIGHYALIIGKAGTLRVLGDRAGASMIFVAPGIEALSSSFLALARISPKLTLQRQSVFEFVLNGAVTGDDTLALEIRRLPRQAIASGTIEGFRITTPAPRLPVVDRRPVDDLLAESHARLITWFDRVAEHYGDRMSCGSSAGYDSRLILAHLARRGIKPHAIVYGKGDVNVDIARRLASALGFDLDVIDQGRAPVEIDKAAETLATNFHSSDGYSYLGLFTNSVEEAERLRRTVDGAAFLHGGGGEIFRDFVQFGDRALSIRGYVQAVFCKFDRRGCGPAFDHDAYVDGIVAKIHALIGDRRDILERHTAEWLYPNFRCRAWFGRDSSLCNRAGTHLLPFYELPITSHAASIPVRHKMSGQYQAALIRLASPKAAAVMSQYGHDFSGDVPLLRRLRDRSINSVPAALRPIAYRLRQRLADIDGMAGYLSEEFVAAALPGKMIVIDQLFDVDAVVQPQQRSRLLGVEYLARQFETKLGLEPGPSRHRGAESR